MSVAGRSQNAYLESQRQELRRLWLLGAEQTDLAVELNESLGWVTWQMSKMRREGYDLPYHCERMRRLLDNWPGG